MKIVLGAVQGIYKAGASVVGKMITRPLVLLVLLVAAVAGGGYAYFQYQQTQQQLQTLIQNPRALSQEESKKVVDQVGEVLDLPKNEDPVVATVIDASKLKGQPFFAKAENGDKVLIYTQGRRAILYRPSSNKIIDVAPVNIGTSSASTGVAGTQTQNVKVALYNGTRTPALIDSAETGLTGEFDNIEIVIKENASRNNYQRVTVVDLSGAQTELAVSIAEFLGGQVGLLPSGESRPDADILVILGNEYRPISESTLTPSSTPARLP